MYATGKILHTYVLIEPYNINYFYMGALSRPSVRAAFRKYLCISRIVGM